MQAFFKSEDKENTGKSTRSSIILAFREQLGVEYSEDKIDYLIKRVDTLGTSHIDYKQFLVSVVAQNKVDNESAIEKAFKKYDPEFKLDVHSREPKEMLKYIEDLNSAQVGKIIKDLDKFTKGSLLYKDFL
jgi:Ca2+-binding EF-hand superfamily protein